MVSERFIPANPVSELEFHEPKAPPIDPYQREHLNLILEATERQRQKAKTLRQQMMAARDHAIVLLFLESGLRLNELAQLSLDDIYLQSQRGVLWDTKTGEGRIFTFGPQSRRALWRYLVFRTKQLPHNRLWIRDDLQPLAGRGVQMIMRRLKLDAGIQVKGSVHKLRHTAVTAFYEKTRDFIATQAFAGHKSESQTRRYTRRVDVEAALKICDTSGVADWLKLKGSKKP